MKKIISIIMALSLLLCVGCSSVSIKNNRFTDEQWVEDVNFLSKYITSSHPDPFRFVSEEDWNKNIDELLNDIPKLSDLEITFRISQILSLLQDGHTVMDITSAIATINESMPEDVLYFPLGYKWFGDEFRVFIADTEYKDVLGCELISINGIEVYEVLSKIYSVLQYDNLQDAKYRACEKGSNYELLKYLGIVDSTSSIFKFKDINGEFVEKEIKAKPIGTVNFIDINSITNPLPKTYIKPLDATDYYWFKSFPEDNILYFQYNNCFGKDTGWVPSEQYRNTYPEFTPVIDGLVNEINTTDFDKFIIDLRKNGGGALALTGKLIAILNKQTDLSSKQVYVIAGKGSYSAATPSVIDIKGTFNATVVGEETGGNVNHTGVISNKIVNLPNSNLNIQLASNIVNNIPGYEGGFKPDVYLEESYTDFVNGIDTYYEYIKNDK